MSQAFLDFCIFVPLFFVGTHIVTKCKVPSDILPIIRLEYVYLMCALIATLTKIASTCDTKLTKVFIAYFGKIFCN